jgi:hypothetical protein
MTCDRRAPLRRLPKSSGRADVQGRKLFSRDASEAIRPYSAWTDTKQDFESLPATMREDLDLALSIGERVEPLPMMRAVKSVLANVGQETFNTWRAVAEGR